MREPTGDRPDSGIVTNAILGGRLILRQPRQGHRAGTDAVMLAAACSLKPRDLVIDVGAGVGTVGLALALREPGLVGFLLDDDPFVSALAAENCRLNRLDARMAAVTADLFDAAARRAVGLLESRADIVVTNPPFFLGTETRVSSDPAKARAYILGKVTESRSHADWLRAATALLAPKGRFYAIHRPDTVPALLHAAEGRLGAIVLVPIYARSDGPAIRVLMSGVKGSRARMTIARPFVLHGPDGRFTPEAEAVHRGEAQIRM